MAILKKEIKSNFTVVHNSFLQDKKLSINARGLLMTMLSMKENWSFSIKGLANILPDGERKISSSLNELEEHGYLIRERKYENGKIVNWDYIFSDEPVFSARTNCGKCGKQPSESPVLNSENLHLQNVDVENVHLQNSGYNKITSNKITFDKTLSNQSRTASQKSRKVFNSPEYELVYRNALTQINSEVLLAEKDDSGQARYTRYEIEVAADLIAWINTTDKKYIKIGDEKIYITLIRNKFAEIKDVHIRGVLDYMKSNKKEIKSFRGYMLSCLYYEKYN